MKIIFTVFCGLFFLAGPAGVKAQYTYVVNYPNTNTITITGYSGPGGVVDIPTTFNNLQVTAIGSGGYSGPIDIVFPSGQGVTDVTVPSSATSIGAGAFWSCTSLSSVALGSGVTSIGEDAFIGCSSLASVTILSTVAAIGAEAFYSCSSLTSINIPYSVTSIGESAFADCSSLANITLPNGISSISNAVFMNCPLSSLTIPNSITSIGSGAFSGCSFTNLIIPDSVISLADSAFNSCPNLTSVTIPNSVTSIGNQVFAGCVKLAGIAFPAGVTNIGNNEFQNDYALTNVIIPNTVTSIGQIAFAGCSNLQNLTIPGSVTNIGQYAFANSSLASVYFTGNSPAVDTYLFSGDNNHPTVYYLPGTGGWSNTFAYFPAVTAVLFNLVIQTNGANFGVRTNQFGFNINWPSGQIVEVEACTNLASPIWTPLETVTLTNGSFYFSDPQWTNYTGRFYRLLSPRTRLVFPR